MFYAALATPVEFWQGGQMKKKPMLLTVTSQEGSGLVFICISIIQGVEN